MRRRETFKRGAQEGQLPLFRKMEQPLVSPAEILERLRRFGEVDERLLVAATKHEILRQIEHEADPKKLKRLKALLIKG